MYCRRLCTELTRSSPVTMAMLAGSKFTATPVECRLSKNCFSVQELEERRLRSFQLHDVRQSHEGDLLEFYRRELSPGVFAVEGVKNGAETVVAGQVCFDRV